jgi:hypothetical protein
MIPLESTKEEAVELGKKLLWKWIKHLPAEFTVKEYKSGVSNVDCNCGGNKAVEVSYEHSNSTVSSQIVRYCNICKK